MLLKLITLCTIHDIWVGLPKPPFSAGKLLGEVSADRSSLVKMTQTIFGQIKHAQTYIIK